MRSMQQHQSHPPQQKAASMSQASNHPQASSSGANLIVRPTPPSPPLRPSHPTQLGRERSSNRSQQSLTSAANSNLQHHPSSATFQQQQHQQGQLGRIGASVNMQPANSAAKASFAPTMPLLASPTRPPSILLDQDGRFEARNELDETLGQQFDRLHSLLLGKSEKEVHSYLVGESRNKQFTNLASGGFFYGILTAASLEEAKKNLARLAISISDEWYTTLCNVNMVLLELFYQLKPVCRERLLFFFAEAIRLRVPKVDNVITNLLRASSEGTAPFVTNQIVHTLADLLLTNKEWMVSLKPNGSFFPVLFMHFTRCIADFHTFQQQMPNGERYHDALTAVCEFILRERIADLAMLGRELPLAMMRVAQLPAFQPFWSALQQGTLQQSIAHGMVGTGSSSTGTKSTSPFPGLAQLMSIPCVTGLLQFRISLQLQRKIDYMQKQLKPPFCDTKHLEWFAKQHLSECPSMRAECIRYLWSTWALPVPSPSQAPTSSSGIQATPLNPQEHPRVILLVWLLMNAAQGAELHWCKMALLIDYFGYTPTASGPTAGVQQQQLWTLEPAFSVLCYLVNSDPTTISSPTLQMAHSLLDFLINGVQTIHPPSTEQFTISVISAFNALRNAGYQVSQQLLESRRLDPALLQAFYQQFPGVVAQPTSQQPQQSLPPLPPAPIPPVLVGKVAAAGQTTISAAAMQPATPLLSDPRFVSYKAGVPTHQQQATSTPSTVAVESTIAIAQKVDKQQQERGEQNGENEIPLICLDDSGTGNNESTLNAIDWSLMSTTTSASTQPSRAGSISSSGTTSGAIRPQISRAKRPAQVVDQTHSLEPSHQLQHHQFRKRPAQHTSTLPQQQAPNQSLASSMSGEEKKALMKKLSFKFQAARAKAGETSKFSFSSPAGIEMAGKEGPSGRAAKLKEDYVQAGKELLALSTKLAQLRRGEGVWGVSKESQGFQRELGALLVRAASIGNATEQLQMNSARNSSRSGELDGAGGGPNTVANGPHGGQVQSAASASTVVVVAAGTVALDEGAALQQITHPSFYAGLFTSLLQCFQEKKDDFRLHEKEPGISTSGCGGAPELKETLLHLISLVYHHSSGLGSCIGYLFLHRLLQSEQVAEQNYYAEGGMQLKKHRYKHDEECRASMLYREWCDSRGMELAVGTQLLQDLEECSLRDHQRLAHLILHVANTYLEELVDESQGYTAFMRLICAGIDSHGLSQLVSAIIADKLILFPSKTATVEMLKSSLGWSTMEQHFLWELIRIHSLNIDWFIPLVSHLRSKKDHGEAMSSILLMLNAAEQMPTVPWVKHLLQRPAATEVGHRLRDELNGGEDGLEEEEQYMQEEDSFTVDALRVLTVDEEFLLPMAKCLGQLLNKAIMQQKQFSSSTASSDIFAPVSSSYSQQLAPSLPVERLIAHLSDFYPRSIVTAGERQLLAQVFESSHVRKPLHTISSWKGEKWVALRSRHPRLFANLKRLDGAGESSGNPENNSRNEAPSKNKKRKLANDDVEVLSDGD